MKKAKLKLFTLIIAAVIAVFNFFFTEEKEQILDPSLQTTDLIIKVLDIGQGDAILIRSGQKVVLIDSGDIITRDQLKKMLKNEGVKDIDLLIATHPHADHIGGMDIVLRNFKVKKVLDSGQVHTSKTFMDYLKYINNHDISFEKVVKGDKYMLDNGAYLEALMPETQFIKGTKGDLNNNSIVLKLVQDEFSMLFTGDIQKEAEDILLKNQKDKLSSTILKSPHHSSRTSSTYAFVKAVGAEVAVVSCGINNDYGYPKEQILKRYKSNNMETYVTAQNGTITIQSDGKKYNITKER